MARQNINVGSAANDGNGDPLRTAFTKVNSNFTELYNAGYITTNSLPTALSDLTNDTGFITANSLPTALSDLTNDTGFITANSLPTALSDLTNDTGFITANSVPSDIIPSEDNSYDLGSLTNHWSTLYVSGTRSDTEFSIITGVSNTANMWTFGDDGNFTFPDGTNQTTAFNFTGYDNEIHVSQTDGNDTTGNGDLLKPVASITKALTLVTGGRLTVVVHPGTYTESPTTSVTNITIATTELTGANTLLNGTLTLGAAARISGLKMNNLTLNTSGNVYISNCTVDTQLIKSGSGYTEIINSELQCSSGCQFTGAGQVFINGNKIFSPSVSNASASVTIRGANQIVTPSVTAGVLTIENSVVVSSSPSSNAITSSASSIVTLANSFVLNSAGTSVERIALSGFYSILNVVYDKANSTLAASSGTGGSTNSVDYFQYINADRLILASGGQITFPDTTEQTTAFTTSPTLNVLKIDDGVHEKFQELADATGTVPHDCSSGQIFYHSSPDANWTVNLTNLNLSSSYATTATIIIDQGNTGYYPNALQIGGSAQTINWQGNATPTPSSNRIDVVSFSILAVSGGYIVFGQLTGF
jgi:hypothetical protein